MQQSSSVSIFNYNISEAFQHLPLEQAFTVNKIRSCILDMHTACSELINLLISCLVTIMLVLFIGVVGVKLLGSSPRIQSSHWNTMWNLD